MANSVFQPNVFSLLKDRPGHVTDIMHAVAVRGEFTFARSGGVTSASGCQTSTQGMLKMNIRSDQIWSHFILKLSLK